MVVFKNQEDLMMIIEIIEVEIGANLAEEAEITEEAEIAEEEEINQEEVEEIVNLEVEEAGVVEIDSQLWMI